MKRGLAALAAVLLSLPALAREDFTLRDSCMAYVGNFTDGTIGSAETDHCDAEPAQEGNNYVDWVSGTTVDDGDVPTNSKPDADSVYHNGTAFGVGAFTASDWYDPTYSAGVWVKLEDVSAVQMIMRRSSGTAPVSGDWSMRIFTAGNWAAAVGTRWGVPLFGGAPLGYGSWEFIAFAYDGAGDETIYQYTSATGNSRTLLDCDNPTCFTIDDDPSDSPAEATAFNSNSIGGIPVQGNTFGQFFHDGEALSDEEFCQSCRCGHAADLRGVGRTAECNRCDLPAYQTCRRFID